MSNGTINKFRLLRKMRGIGINCDIAGGYPRDIANNADPRDIDIVAIGSKAQAMMLRVWLEKNSLLSAPVTYDSSLDNEEYEDDRIWCVMKVCSDTPIDIIFWNETDYADTDDIVTNGFDFNINQYILDGDSPLFLGSDEGCLTQVREEVNDSRTSKMTECARKLGWKVV